MKREIYIKIEKNGPYLLYGASKIGEKIIISDERGAGVRFDGGKCFEIKRDPAALCRCGKSKCAPFCDCSHRAGFDGTEAAHSNDDAEFFKGPGMTLKDNQEYCAFARFCGRGGRIWNLVLSGENPDLAIEQANLCPAGRLMMFTRDGRPLEKTQTREVNVIEDDGLKISGPLWIKGRVKVIAADGTAYEVRPKQTLCRCGASKNKPFCNGAHASIHWKAGSR